MAVGPCIPTIGAELMLSYASCLLSQAMAGWHLTHVVFHCQSLCSWRFPRAQLRKLCEKRGRFTAEDLDFQEKIAFRTGLGDDTAVVPAIQAGRDEALGMEPARFEFAATCFPTIQEVLDKAGVGADQINFVITNSSLFNPTPSLSAMIVNHFKMGKKTIGYSLGGMGCSAGIIALDLARELLELHPNSYALVVSHENITNNFYVGEHGACTCD
jgi:3-ketoacyl-CoA synthase